MTVDQRDKILTLTRKQYGLLECQFPVEGNLELVEYLYESNHGAETSCLVIAIEAHNLYNDDNLNDHDFFEWHGL